ncbi:MAG: hypothetical protein EOO57_14685, partial [Hymenobacter sp.]
VGAHVGDVIRVFVYRDSEDRLIATTLEPLAVVDSFAALTGRAHRAVLLGQQQVAVVAGEVEADADFAGYFEVVKIAELKHGGGVEFGAKVGILLQRCLPRKARKTRGRARKLL